MDQKIEKVELGLRKLIADTLNEMSENPYKEFTPSHIQERINERIEREIKRKPGLTSEEFKSFEIKLDLFDLQEYVAIIGSKICWPSFEVYFKNKEQLQSRFNQLATLRNGIRHSRSISDIERADGLAAILWFKTAMNITI